MLRQWLNNWLLNQDAAGWSRLDYYIHTATLILGAAFLIVCVYVLALQ